MLQVTTCRFWKCPRQADHAYCRESFSISGQFCGQHFAEVRRNGRGEWGDLLFAYERVGEVSSS